MSERLHARDAVYLHIERPDAPMNTGGALVFRGDLHASGIAERIIERLHATPRLLQLPVEAPAAIVQPSWEDDENFDLRRHVFERHLTDGDEMVLRAHLAEIFSSPLARSKPLWELYVLRGLAHGRSALVSKIHHAMIDGSSQSDFLLGLLSKEPRPASPCRGPGELAETPLVTRRRRQSLRRELERARRDRRLDRNRALGALASGVFDLGLPFERLSLPENIALRTMLMPLEPLPFNGPNSCERELAWHQIPRREVEDLSSLTGATINDLMLATLGHALGRRLEQDGFDTRGRTVRFSIPVALRPMNSRQREGQPKARARPRGFGNSTSMFPLEAPLDLKRPLDLLCHLSSAARAAKEGLGTQAFDLGMAALDLLPVAFQKSLRFGSGPLLPPTHLICSNMRGPSEQLYAAEAEARGSASVLSDRLPAGAGLCRLQHARDDLAHHHRRPPAVSSSRRVC